MKRSKAVFRNMKFYEDAFVGKDILKKVKQLVTPSTPLKFDSDIVHGPNRGKSSQIDIARDEYTLLDLNFFGDKTAMKEELESVDKKFWKTHNLDEYWEQYLEREKLIAAGLYEKARQEVFTENYLRTAEEYMGSTEALDVVRKNLERLTPEEFVSLTRPQGDRDTSTSALPSIQEFYPLSGVALGHDYYEDIISRFKKAFSEANITWKNFETKKEEAELSTVPVTSKRILVAREFKSGSYKSNYGKTFKTIFRQTSLAGREKILETATISNRTVFTEQEDALKALKVREDELLSKGRALVFINRNGDYYIPFVRKDIAKEYLKKYYGK